MEMKELSNLLIKMVVEYGACSAGISTIETLEGGPASTDLTYVLEGAKSALTFAIPLKQSTIEPYLMKKDHVMFIPANYIFVL